MLSRHLWAEHPQTWCSFMQISFGRGLALSFLIGTMPLAALSVPATAQPSTAQPAATQANAAVESQLPYADLVDLAAGAPLTVLGTVRRASTLDADRTGPVRAGWARVYVEVETNRLIAGTTPVGQKLKFLADVRRDGRGKVPKLKNRDVVLFARPVPGRPGELQLVAPDAMLPVEAVGTARLRELSAQLLDPAAPPVVTGVRDAWHTPGNLAGEGETQIFLDTPGEEAASITIVRRPGQAPRWGLSIGELVNSDSRPPERGTLAWYRLACALPANLPQSALSSGDPAQREAAVADYALVIEQLGECGRTRVF